MSEEYFHVFPKEDLIVHVASAQCICQPVQDEEEPNVWVHNLLDIGEEYD